MIKDSEVFSIGKITRVRGLAGEVELAFTDDAFDRGDAEYIVLSMDGILVPFFWEEYKFKNDHTAIFSFENIKDEETAKAIVGAEAFYPFSYLPEGEEEELSSLSALKGYTLYNQDNLLVGKIITVDESTSNVLIYLEDEQGEEIILPYHDELLMGYDLKQHRLQIEIPEGLIELNKS